MNGSGLTETAGREAIIYRRLGRYVYGLPYFGRSQMLQLIALGNVIMLNTCVKYFMFININN